jgi:hypothetical protein
MDAETVPAAVLIAPVVVFKLIPLAVVFALCYCGFAVVLATPLVVSFNTCCDRDSACLRRCFHSVIGVTTDVTVTLSVTVARVLNVSLSRITRSATA